MERSCNYLKLLILCQLVEVYGISAYTNCKRRIFFRIFHGIYKLFAVENVNVQMMCLLREISVKNANEI